MSVLNTLKLVTSKRLVAVSPIAHKRNKLSQKIQEQIELCEAQKAGAIYAPKKLKTFTDQATGERRTIETVKRVKEWFWINEASKINLSIKYGAKTISLNKKGANAIELATGDELVATLKTLKTAVLNGELDDAIAEASKATRTAFGK